MNKNFTIIGDLKESQVDGNVIKNVVILSEHSLNKRNYTEDCQRKATTIFEGMKSFVDHGKDGENRKVRDLIGYYSNVHYVAEEKKTKGDLNLIPDEPETGKILKMAETMPHLVGNSIHARGRYNTKDGIDVVEEIIEAFSGDIVTNPATTKGLFEEKNEEVDSMDIKELTLPILESERPDLFKVYKDEIDGLKESKKSLEQELDDYKAKEAIAEKRETVMQKIKENELPDQLVSDIFIETLIAAKDEKVDKLIEDRKKLQFIGDGVTGNGEHKKPDGEAPTDDDFVEAVKES